MGAPLRLAVLLLVLLGAAAAFATTGAPKALVAGGVGGGWRGTVVPGARCRAGVVRQRHAVCHMSLVDRRVTPIGDPSDAKIDIITSMESFEDAVAASQGDQLVVIKAYVPWCRACKAFDLKFRRLSLELAGKGAPAHFYEIDLFEVQDVKKLLEIKLAPSVVMYLNGEKVASFNCGPKRFDIVVEQVSHHLAAIPNGSAYAISAPSDADNTSARRQR